MKTRVLIVDDEQEARNVLSALLKKHQEIEVVAEANDVDTGIVKFLEHRPDIVFLDVQMPRKDGFAFVDSLKTSLNGTSIIFVTAYQKFAVEAIKHSAFDFLLKPVSQLDLQQTIERYKEQSRGNMQIKVEKLLNNLAYNRKIKLDTRTGFAIIDTEEILHIRADGNYSKIYCSSGRVTLSTITLKNMEVILKEYQGFYRINRSEIVNINYLSIFDRTKRKCVLYADNQNYEFKIARERVKEFEALV